MADNKKYLSVFNDGTQDIYIKDAEAWETIDELVHPLETDGGVDTLFDTEYDAENERIVFGDGCASFDATSGILSIEGAVQQIDDPVKGSYLRIVIS